MYEPPIEILKCVENSIKKENEFIENEVYSRILKVGVNVDKEELIKALRYDREQYQKGYKDGYEDGIIKFAERLKSKFTHSGKSTKYGNFTWDDVTSYELDNLVKEMTEFKG